MTEGQVLDLLQMSVWMTLVGAGPAMLAAMGVGFTISLIQALTQVQEMTLAFVPKLVVVFAVLSLTASFIGAQFYVFAERIYAEIESGLD